MAKHGAELLSLAREHNVDLLYEASVGGGIPIIAPLKRDLLANDIVGVTAIINGTTNYILTSMSKGGRTFADALAGAQALGFAEPDPTNDVEGIDATYKLCVLATLAFHMDVHPDDVYREGITKLGDAGLRVRARPGIRDQAAGDRPQAGRPACSFACIRRWCRTISCWRASMAR